MIFRYARPGKGETVLPKPSIRLHECPPAERAVLPMFLTGSRMDLRKAKGI